MLRVAITSGSLELWCSMKTLVTMVAIAGFLSLCSVRAEEKGNKEEAQLKADVQKVLKNVGEKTEGLLKASSDLPEKLPSKWDDVLAGATRIEATVAKLKEVRETVQKGVKGLSGASGETRAELHRIEQGFRTLAEQAQAELDGTAKTKLPPLPAPLVAKVKREIEIHAASAEVCKEAALSFATTLGHFKEEVALLDRCGPMFDRFHEAALLYRSLAKVGKRLELAKKVLGRFSEELNDILDQLDQMNVRIRSAISDVPTPGPATSRLMDAQELYFAGLRAGVRRDVDDAERLFRAALANHRGSDQEARAYSSALRYVLLARR